MRTSLTRLVAAVLLATSASNAMAATDAGPKAIVDGIANTAITGGHCDGLAIGIDQAGTENEYFYGKSGTVRAIDGKTVFEIASVTKTFAALILALATQRADKPMRLDDSLQKYAPPGVTLPSLNGTPIRLVDLATHTAGLPRQDTDTSAPQPPKQVWAFTAGLTLNSEPGTKFLYSNLGFGLLSDAEERDQKQGFGQLLKAQITGPLGMSDTVITVSPDQQARKAQGHRAGGRNTPPQDPTKHLGLLGAGSLNSTLDDLMKYLAFQMGGGSGPLMQAAVLTQTPIRPTGPKGQIGLAWNTNKLGDGTSFINKDGTSKGGFTSYVAFTPSTQTGVVVLSNRLGCKVPLISHNLLSALNKTPLDAATAADAPSDDDADVSQ
jgi:D-alanyl-D-alanine-carboxypeptidase/D-alanyl-D-alanine-endopeptidase